MPTQWRISHYIGKNYFILKGYLRSTKSPRVYSIMSCVTTAEVIKTAKLIMYVLLAITLDVIFKIASIFNPDT